MNAYEKCEYCGRVGEIGKDIVSYYFTPKYSQWLCGIHTDEKCSAARYKAFRKWLKINQRSNAIGAATEQK